MEASIPKLNKVIDVDHLHDGALQIIRVIRPEWAQERLHYKIFTDGITNRLIGVYRDDMKDMILIRVYGENTDLFIDRQMEFRNMRTMYKANLSAPIYCTFTNGISYGFTPGKVLDERMVRDTKISALIAENMAKMHTLKPMVSSVSTEFPTAEPHQCLFPGIDKFLGLIASAFTVKLSCQKQKCFCHLDNLQEQANFLKAELQMLNSPIVFCHNDLLLKNILYDESQNKVTFIDFEYSDYNYQAFDIANHFCEFCGVDNFEPSLYPSKDFQLRWLRIYLQKWNSHNDITPTAAELEQSVESLYDVVSRFALASHLYWGLWAVVQANNSSIDFNYLGFAHKRLEEYFKRKHELFGKNNHHKH